MTLAELYSDLKTAFPNDTIFYDHIVIDEGQEIYPPFTVFQASTPAPFFADDTTYYCPTQISIRLFMSPYDPAYEKKYMDRLKKKKIPFDYDPQPFNDETQLFETDLTITLKGE